MRWDAVKWARSGINYPPLPAKIRPLERPELERLAGDPGYDIAGRFLERLEPRPDLCLGAQIDEHLRFHFPERWLYLYKVFARPHFRGRRLLSHMFFGGVPLIAEWLGPIEEPIGFVTLVPSDNEPSLKAFARLGFRSEEEFLMLRLRSRPFLLAMAPIEPSGFFIEKIRNGPALA